MDVYGVGALVTGGASGLGAATVERLRAAGAEVVVADLQGPAPVDVADAEAMEALVATVPNLRVLVCCAGLGSQGGRVVRRSGPHSLADFERMVRVNLVGTFNAVRLAAWAMSRLEPTSTGERGVIVTTSSIAAFDGVTGGAAYAASKAGVAGMTLPLARDLGPHGIRVVSVAPGSFDTPMASGMLPQFQQQLADETPFPPRFGAPDEFAALVEHIVANPMLNGEVIRIDGGLRMRPL
jgi:NAD(P)-dependent dehydrogenase (short-subunit alcohol dehydrogenase family)